MKRKLSDLQCSPSVKESTRSKKPYLLDPREYDNYVSASSVINWFLNDCLVDWLKLRRKIVETDFKEENYLIQQGNKFEEKVVEWIDKNIIKTVKVADSKDWSVKNVKKTFELMKDATPIIYSGAIRSKYLKLYGTADLIVRNDYIPKLFTDLELSEVKCNTLFDHQYYYYIIDIKWCTLQLAADGQSILNSGRFPGYKGQLTIYNNCLAEMQGYKPMYAFLLGRKIKYTHKGKDYSTNSPFSLPGVFKTNDYEFNNKVNGAIEWVRDLNKHGLIMNINPPCRKELYPNLGSKYYYSKKRELAEEIGDLSLIYKVKTQKKNIAFEKGITNIYDYRLTGEKLNFKGKEKEIIDKIIMMNRQTEKKIDFGTLTKDIIKEENEIFVDFEKLTDIFDNFEDISNHKTFDMIFLIGVYYKKNDRYKYKRFLLKELSDEKEFELINKFYRFIERKNFPKLWYWFAEDKFWNSTMKKHNLNYNLNFVDLRNLFLDNRIVVKDAFDFKLKTIINAMKKNELIDTKNDSEVEDGMTAMLKAYDCYQKNDKEYLKEICKYNKFDVKGMYDIVNYLRDKLER